MEESPVVYIYNAEELKNAMLEAHAKNGRSIKGLRKYYPVPLILFLLLISSILIAFPLANYSFLIVIFLILFLCSLLYIPFFLYQLFETKKGIKRIQEFFEKYKYYQVMFTEHDITIETDIEKNIQKWQEVHDVSFEGDLCSFRNGSTTYFFVQKSMLPAHVEKLKELVLAKSKTAF